MRADKVASRDVGDIGDRQTDVMTLASTGRVGQQSVLPRRFQDPRIFILLGKAESDLSVQFYHRDLSALGRVSHLPNCIIQLRYSYTSTSVRHAGWWAN